MKGEVLGFRTWRVARERGGLELHSSGLGKYKWRPDYNEAICQTSSLGTWFETTPWWQTVHDAPDHGCTCGLYAYHEAPLVETYGLAGAVLGWGQMEVHHRGWRAQYAKPVLFGMPPEIRDYPEAYELLRELAFRFDAKLVPEDALEAAGKAFGEPIPPDMRPPAPPPPEEIDPAVYNVTTNAGASAAIAQLYGKLGRGR